ncbi:hypothetical protein DBY21_05775 [Candidatus Gastranaerophilales bacterium]|nr:MAG: hypothetical protein DBY21_05775 [Candidatus Gastranaerophilales bacterium]
MLRGGGHPKISSFRAKKINLCQYVIKPAFTLSETLITLAVIGIVAAMTLPSLVGRYQEKVTVNKLKQTYSLLSQAFEQAINEEGPVENWCNINGGSETYNDCSVKMTNILGRYVKKLRDCYDFSKDKNICLSKSYLNRYSSSTWNPSSDWLGFVMTNGVAVAVTSINGDRNRSTWCAASLANTRHMNRYTGNCGSIYVDLNSVGRPNISDRDLFAFSIYKDGITPFGKANDTVWVDSFDLCIGKKIDAAYPGRCAAWVIVNENMDYLHCSDLSWSGKSKCSK